MLVQTDFQSLFIRLTIDADFDYSYTFTAVKFQPRNTPIILLRGIEKLQIFDSMGA